MDFPIDYIKEFLEKKFNSDFVLNSDLDEIQKYYYQIFVSILRLVFAFIVPNTSPFSRFDFFSLLDDSQKGQFIAYSKMGNSALDCLGICNLSQKVLNGINLNGTNLWGKSIVSSKIQYASFIDSVLSSAYLMGSDFALSNFDNAQCYNANFSNCILYGCSFLDARLSGSDFTNACLDNADFRGAELKKCKFNGASLNHAKISVEQLPHLYDFDLTFLKQNHIEIYSDNRLVSEELIEETFRSMRPVAYAFYKLQ